MVNEPRPDPDKLLSQLKKQEAQEKRGMLKIFFGFAPGVGKTYSMLQEAKLKQSEGLQVLAGIVETHQREETDKLLEGIEVLPRKTIAYRGIALQELDLETALKRRPTLILVDELAHTNAPGSHHRKRWQDIDELLQAGIHVYTTLNVQHLESLNDVIAQITGVAVRETVPDSILDRADELELVDLPPEELLKRLQEGKVYIPDQAAAAMQNFFRKGNLIALRELALRQTAARVGAQMRDYKREKYIDSTWPTSERLLVGVSSSPTSARLVRATFRMAKSLRAEWFAVYVETPTQRYSSQADKDRVIQHLRLAAQLGAQTAAVTGASARDAILSYAHEHNITKIVVGKPLRRRWKDFLVGSVVDELIWHCGDIDIYVITGEGDKTPVSLSPPRKYPILWRDYFWSLCGVGICSFLAWIMFPYFTPANLIMIYLLGVVLIAESFGRGPSIFASILSVAVFDFFFIPPHLTFAVADSQYFITLLVMLLVAVLISNQVHKIRYQADTARKQERKTAALYEISKKLATCSGLEPALSVVEEHLTQSTNSRVTLYLPDQAKRLQIHSGFRFPTEEARELDVAQWVFEKGKIAGAGTDTLSGTPGTFFPLCTAQGILGVMRIEPDPNHRTWEPERMQYIEAVCSLLALAIEREYLSQQARERLLQVESERLRNTLLSSVSHDLRTPLTAIAGSAGSLLEGGGLLDSQTRQELTQMIFEEARRLDHQVGNLLEISRFESGAVPLHCEWHVLEEIVGSAIHSLNSQLEQRNLAIRLPADMPLVKVDAMLIERVLYNFLENAVKYTPPNSPIEITAQWEPHELSVQIADHGPGLPAGEEARIFEKFHRTAPGCIRGIGLGLTICRSIIDAHGGKIWAQNRTGGGAVFGFFIPQQESAPTLEEITQRMHNDAVEPASPIGD